MKALLLLILMGYSFTPVMSQTSLFKSNEDTKKVYKGEIITIEADSAFIISSKRAAFLNKKLDHLDTITHVYEEVLNERKKLTLKLERIQSTFAELIIELNSDRFSVDNDFDEILREVDSTMSHLESANQQFKEDHEKLTQTVITLEKNVKQLRKKVKGIWWDGVKDKLVAFGVGFGAGLLIGIL